MNVLILPCNTDFQVAMAAVANPRGQFMLSPCNADPTVAKKYGNYWPVGMAGNAQLAQLANYAKLRKIKKVYVLDAPQMLYVHLMAQYFRKAAPSRGIQIVGSDDIPFGATGFPQDYSAIATKIKNESNGAQAIMTGLFSPFVDFLARDLRRAGVNLPVLGTDGMDTQLNLTTGKDAVDGYGFTTFGYPDRGSPTARFYAQFRGKFGASPDGTYPALGYDTIKVLEAAVLKAGRDQRQGDPGRSCERDDGQGSAGANQVQGLEPAQPHQHRRRRADQEREVRQGPQGRSQEGSGAVACGQKDRTKASGPTLGPEASWRCRV